ncbi:hypothetical protein DYH56_14680 [Psychrilyobacter piezotolerans]|uniref:Uncharacterized protein n=2 Tax=Fusobacteriaceae TaxID=203492 RepID=A0ABX9KD75_9FUSO|nr:hypothetical protein DV867_14680 [Psychrilyobacter sp. S5]REI39477.1 hypothetical protein DYH56_14680 [Psychrilyobacter piezotolerans]
MKKIFLIFALTALMNIGVNAEENKTDIAIFRDREWTKGVDGEENNDAEQQEQSATDFFESESAPDADTTTATVAPTALADSFMAAFGMEVDAGGSGDAGPGMEGGSSGGTMAAGMSVISTTSANQVTPPFTPYSYQK